MVSFSACTALAGDNVLPADIGVFVVSVVVGHWISYRILLAHKAPRLVAGLALVSSVIMVAAFSFLSYHPFWLPPIR